MNHNQKLQATNPFTCRSCNKSYSIEQTVEQLNNYSMYCDKHRRQEKHYEHCRILDEIRNGNKQSLINCNSCLERFSK